MKMKLNKPAKNSQFVDIYKVKLYDGENAGNGCTNSKSCSGAGNNCINKTC